MQLKRKRYENLMLFSVDFVKAFCRTRFALTIIYFVPVSSLHESSTSIS